MQRSALRGQEAGVSRRRVSVLVAAMVAVVLVVGGTWALERESCMSAAEDLGLPGRWGPLDGCRVVVDGAEVTLRGERYVEP